MTKEEIINAAKIFLEINGQDKRLVTSLKDSLEALFEKNEIKIPFESLSIAELNDNKTKLMKAQASKLLPESAKKTMFKVITKIENRIKELS